MPKKEIKNWEKRKKIILEVLPILIEEAKKAYNDGCGVIGDIAPIYEFFDYLRDYCKDWSDETRDSGTKDIDFSKLT